MEKPVLNKLLPVREDVSLAPFSSFRIGGSARYFFDAVDIVHLTEAIAIAEREQLSWCILGGGSNILINDKGFDGLVIRMGLDDVSMDENRISAGAGADLLSVVRAAAGNGLSGIEPLAGIPGTVGGAVRGNAGAFGAAIGDVTEEVTVLDAGTLALRTYPRHECCFGYRRSMFKNDRRLVVVSVLLKMRHDTAEQVEKKTTQTLEKRSVLLHAEKSAGSFFMNLEGAGEEIVRKFEEERGMECRNCTIPAGWLIEQAGMRGQMVGGAMVSELHANYIVNTGSATAEDVLKLARKVKEQVRVKFGVELEEEVTFIGF